ncbi:TVP38/TMEM64 family protein [Rhodobacterales bacterium HKCCE4037]|nr:TVP38/TMEM64 family protein [Rhodobacterales bacterium HKCCE4037]
MADSVTEPQKSGLGRYLPLIAVLIGAGVGYYFFQDYLSFQALADNREALLAFRDENYVLTVAAFMLAYTLIVAFSLPGATVATLTGGFLFATFPGVLFNVTAATLGATAIFLAVQTSFGDRIAARLEGSEGLQKRFKEAIDENQWSALFLLRLVPAVPFFVANVLPALFKVPLKRYVITTFFGIMPGALVYTSVGAGLGEVFERGDTPDLGIIFEPQILFPILGLCALALLPIVLKAVRGRKGI